MQIFILYADFVLMLPGIANSSGAQALRRPVATGCGSGRFQDGSRKTDFPQKARFLFYTIGIRS